MPALPGWYARVDDILASLETAPYILDRPAFEKLFRVSRRQAIRLMGMAGGYQIGKTFLVERASLTDYLLAVQQSQGARQAQQRKRRILHYLHERIAKPAAAPALQWPGVTKAGPGQLTISYSSAADLLSKIAALASAAAEDYPRFREAIE